MRPVPGTMVERLELVAEPFAAKGFEDTRIEDLAEATGIPKATLYYHFAGKEEILSWLLMRVLAEFADAVGDAAAGGGSARERLGAVVRAELGVMAQHPTACRVLLSELGRAGRIPATAEAIIAAFHLPVRQLLVEGKQDRSLPKVGDPEALASAIFGAVTLTGLHYLLADHLLDADRVSKTVVALLTAGLGD